MLTAIASDETTPKVLSFMKASSHSSAGLALAFFQVSNQTPPGPDGFDRVMGECDRRARMAANPSLAASISDIFALRLGPIGQ
jgi:hypothetical protein